MESAKNLLKPITLDDSMVESLKQSIEVVLQQYFNVKCEFGAPVRARHSSETADLSGVITIFQKDFQGTMSLGFPRDMIFQFMKTIYRKDFAKVDQSVIDGVGEITNSVYGQLRRHLNEQGHSLQMTIPTVVIGVGHSITPYSDKPTLVLPITTANGNFHATVVLESYPTLRGV